jgi:hypothetical protein
MIILKQSLFFVKGSCRSGPCPTNGINCFTGHWRLIYIVSYCEHGYLLVTSFNHLKLTTSGFDKRGIHLKKALG